MASSLLSSISSALPGSGATADRSEDYKSSLLPRLLDAHVLSFGTYTLKSGRVSPYFFTSSLLHTSTLLAQLAKAYAAVLTAPPFSLPLGTEEVGLTATVASASTSSASVSASAFPGEDHAFSSAVVGEGSSAPHFDVLFGPAYKGIPLAAVVARELEFAGPAFAGVSYAFNRKEAKAHGEGGTVVGAPLRGTRAVIVDDVMTAGTALREAVQIITAQGGRVVGVVLLLNRQERVGESEARSAVKVAEDELGVPVRAVLTFDDILEAVRDGKIVGVGAKEEDEMKAYRERYGARD